MRTRHTNGRAKPQSWVSHSWLPNPRSSTNWNNLGLSKAEYACGYFKEMGIGCRRDPLEANVWYVKAADSGDDRAKQRLAIIQAAASGQPHTPANNNTKNKLSKEKGGKDE